MVLNNNLRRPLTKVPMQNPLNPEVYTLLRAGTQNLRRKTTPSSRALSSIDRVRLQIFQVTKRETRFMRRRQHNLRSVPGIERFLPPRCAEAPFVAGLQTGKPKLKIGRRQVVAGRFRERQELGRQYNTNRVRPDVLRPGVAAAVPEKPGHRRSATGCQLLAQHIFGIRGPVNAVGRGNSDHNTCFRKVYYSLQPESHARRTELFSSATFNRNWSAPLFQPPEPSARSGVWYNVRTTFPDAHHWRAGRHCNDFRGQWR